MSHRTNSIVGQAAYEAIWRVIWPMDGFHPEDLPPLVRFDDHKRDRVDLHTVKKYIRFLQKAGVVEGAKRHGLLHFATDYVGARVVGPEPVRVFRQLGGGYAVVDGGDGRILWPPNIMPDMVNRHQLVGLDGEERP